MASHEGGSYIVEQTVYPGDNNSAGAVVYEREGGTIYRKNSCFFGEDDIYCPMWNLLGLAGIGGRDWTPQYRYWQRPEQMDDGGKDLQD